MFWFSFSQFRFRFQNNNVGYRLRCSKTLKNTFIYLHSCKKCYYYCVIPIHHATYHTLTQNTSTHTTIHKEYWTVNTEHKHEKKKKNGTRRPTNRKFGLTKTAETTASASKKIRTNYYFVRTMWKENGQPNRATTTTTKNCQNLFYFLKSNFPHWFIDIIFSWSLCFVLIHHTSPIEFHIHRFLLSYNTI